MGNLKKSTGNMYSWVTHQWSPGKGCQHDCEYCYVKSKRWNYDPGKIFISDTKFPNLGSGRTIFVGHTCDMWSEEVPVEFINKVLWHCTQFTGNKYIFQSKNPTRFLTLQPVSELMLWLNNNEITLGTTIETNRQELIEKYSKAPDVQIRSASMAMLKEKGFKTFITIEPVMDFDIDDMSYLITSAKPDWVNIGADSKGHNLPEPSAWKLMSLIGEIHHAGIEIRNKSNLKRLGI